AKARAAMRIKGTKVSFFITNSSSCEYFLRSGDESKARGARMMKLCVLIELESPIQRFGCRASPGSCLTPAGRPGRPVRQPVEDDCRWIAARTWRLGFPPPKSGPLHTVQPDHGRCERRWSAQISWAAARAR